VLLTESTYGGRRHGPMSDARDQLAHVVGETLKRGGLLIIPAFAVGRTQDIVYHLHELFEAGAIPAVPVYVDSPLATNVTEVFRLHPECYDEETHQHLLHDHHKEPFGFARLTYVRDAEDSKKLNDLQEPAIIISASGMCEGGRVLHHLRHHIGDPRTSVLFVGYQAANTLGRKLVEGEKRVRIFGEDHTVNARIVTIDGYSAHADERELLEFIDAIPQRPRQVFVVHGEPEATRAMSEGLRGLASERDRPGTRPDVRNQLTGRARAHDAQWLHKESGGPNLGRRIFVASMAGPARSLSRRFSCTSAPVPRCSLPVSCHPTRTPATCRSVDQGRR